VRHEQGYGSQEGNEEEAGQDAAGKARGEEREEVCEVHVQLTRNRAGALCFSGRAKNSAGPVVESRAGPGTRDYRRPVIGIGDPARRQGEFGGGGQRAGDERAVERL
jgi:hypothetical protein